MGKERIFVFDDSLLEGGGPAVRGVENWSRLIANEAEGKMSIWEEMLDGREAEKTTAVLNYSSGTTGLPKGVEITHAGYVANGAQFKHLVELDPRERASGERAAYLCFLPMYHAMAQTIFCSIAPARRVPVYIMRKYNFMEMLINIQRFRVTDLTVVPPIVARLAKHPEVRAGQYDLSSAERVRCGGAPLGREICEEFERLWEGGKVNVKQAWGMTVGPQEDVNQQCRWRVARQRRS
jgi:4-coumarate--CoA ligase